MGLSNCVGSHVAHNVCQCVCYNAKGLETKFKYKLKYKEKKL